MSDLEQEVTEPEDLESKADMVEADEVDNYQQDNIGEQDV